MAKKDDKPILQRLSRPTRNKLRTFLKELDNVNVPAIRDGGTTACKKRAAAITKFALYLHALEEVVSATKLGRLLVLSKQSKKGMEVFEVDKIAGRGGATMTYETRVEAPKAPRKSLRRRAIDAVDARVSRTLSS